MPYASESQRRLFHSDPKLQKYTAEYDAASKGKHLPEKVMHKKIKKGMARAFPKGK